MNALTSFAYLDVAPGSGLTFDPLSGEIRTDPTQLTAGVDCVVTARAADGAAVAAYRVAIAEVPLTPEVPVIRDAATRFDNAAALTELQFHATAAPSLALGGDFATLVPASASRVTHGIWSKAGGDGLYRCLFRWRGGLVSHLDRRFGFGARIGFDGSNWTGIRADVFETAIGQKRLHLREYTGSSTNATQLQTKAVAWSFDAWQWLEVEVVGSTVRTRLYAEAEAAPDWQVVATVTETRAGAFGPAAVPAASLSPQIDIRALEFRAP